MFRAERLRGLMVVLVAVVVVASACSSSTTKSSAAHATVAGTKFVRPACHATRPAPPKSASADGGTSEFNVTSFDGTQIRAHWFSNPAASKAKSLPTVLKGPGWSQPGDTNTASKGDGIFGDLNIANLWDAGYNVLTWDPRGFGKSGGVVSTNDPDHEGRDTQILLDWVATQPGVQLDAPGDPRVGMVGGSYGGDIQIVLAVLDCRVDAIVPTIAWHSLGTSLYKAETVKQGWGDQLYSFAKGHPLDPHITSAYESGHATGAISAEDAAWFRSRGPADSVKQITIPTLFVQGTVDTLFTLDEAVSNYLILKAKGVPTGMIWFCGGHGVCLTKAGDQSYNGRAAIAWLARYVKGDRSIAIGPGFSVVDQNGAQFVADAYPAAAGDPVTTKGSGTLPLVPITVSVAVPVQGAPSAVLGAVANSITPARATNGLEVSIPFTKPALVLGAPTLTITYKGTAPAGELPTRVFAQIVDPTTGLVLGNLVTPIKVELDGAEHTTTVPLEMIVFSASSGAKLTLQLVASTASYAQPRMGGTVDFGAIGLTLPTVTGMKPAN
jgi:Dipeptidyl aminopeptidases/acylaminoacyl-peptidases